MAYRKIVIDELAHGWAIEYRGLRGDPVRTEVKYLEDIKDWIDNNDWNKVE